ncbi:uncharacterized protein LOC133113987 isoform X2 [Conger conger]|uniref:uncharacterized protein LOC133113987 isoform X2 n=1 Tax=Conger conger TaxID=82655 RepID=UPI002A5AFFB5|nr:uncharacterized protein LOC133113987 isoform X2 [Conger conger]
MEPRTCRLLLVVGLLLELTFCANENPDCPLLIQPPRVVVRHGDPVSVNCTISGDHDGMGWKASERSVFWEEHVQFVTWRLKTLTDWEIGPYCYAEIPIDLEDTFLCNRSLNIAVYKPPDSVSISVVNHTGPMLEGKQYQLQCEVQTIAPVPVNVSSTLLITPTSADDGAQYSCVAELELGPGGPQPPEVKFDPLNITVLYKPSSAQTMSS